tara:strand:- start:840 stop:1109 length:270 start_codon:yes stop_codon:yes gene_type:complete
MPVRNILAGATTFSKKRNFVNFQEASESFIEDSSKANQPSDELNLKTSVAKPNKYDLWTTKYTPFSLVSIYYFIRHFRTRLYLSFFSQK